MAQTMESWYRSTLTKKLNATDNTMTVATAPTVTSWRIFLKSWTQKEWIKYTWVTWTTLTWLVRWLSQTADPSTAWTGLTWIAWTEVILVAMHDQLLDKQEPQQSIQVAKTYATTVARDSALWWNWAALYNYADIYVTDTWLFYNYNLSSNIWEVQWSWTATPNASTTSAWKVEISTTAESKAGTDTWWTWAKLTVLPSDIAANEQSWTFIYWVSTDLTDTYTTELTPTLTAYTTWMSVKVKFDTANTWACSLNIDWLWAKAIKSRDWNDIQDWVIKAGWIYELIYDWTNFVIQTEDFATAINKGIVEMLTDVEATAWTDETRYINSKQAKDNYWACSVIASDNLKASSDTQVSGIDAVYTKVKEMQIWKLEFWWTIRIKFTLNCSNWANTAYWRIYKNWVAVWTERSVLWDTPTVFSEDIASLENWDLIQIYAKNDWSWASYVITNFRIYYDKVSEQDVKVLI